MIVDFRLHDFISGKGQNASKGKRDVATHCMFASKEERESLYLNVYDIPDGKLKGKRDYLHSMQCTNKTKRANRIIFFCIRKFALDRIWEEFKLKLEIN